MPPVFNRKNRVFSKQLRQLVQELDSLVSPLSRLREICPISPSQVLYANPNALYFFVSEGEGGGESLTSPSGLQGGSSKVWQGVSREAFKAAATGCWTLVWGLPWCEISKMRWDGESELLEIVCWRESRGQKGRFVFRPESSPTTVFMNLVREGIGSTQVFAAPVQLPGGQKITVQVLRDLDRKLVAYPGLSAVKSAADRQYLQTVLQGWEQKLGLKVSGDTDFN